MALRVDANQIHGSGTSEQVVEEDIAKVINQFLGNGKKQPMQDRRNPNRESDLTGDMGEQKSFLHLNKGGTQSDDEVNGNSEDSIRKPTMTQLAEGKKHSRKHWLDFAVLKLG